MEVEPHEIKYKDFQNRCWPGFCITAHAAQGKTLRERFTIYDWDHPRADETFRYVCMSRATCCANVQIHVGEIDLDMSWMEDF